MKDLETILNSENNDTKNDVKPQITDMLIDDPSFQKIVNVYKNNRTTCIVCTISDDGLNGLGNKFYCIRDKNTNIVEKIIVPVFSTSNTITWNQKYIDMIKAELTINNIEFIDTELEDKILITLNIYDNDINDSAFIQVCTLNSFLRTGITGKHSYNDNVNKYKWLDKLPDNTAMKLHELEKNYFLDKLPDMKYDELYNYCNEYAIKNWENFYNPNNRTREEVITNITDGLVIEYIHAANLISNFGTDAVFVNDDTQGDDTGVDIILNVNRKNVKIDVKSTKSSNLSITSKRDDTDFYAIYNNNTKYKTPKFLGYVHKSDFWTDEVKEYQGRYLRSLDSLKDNIIVNEMDLFTYKLRLKMNKFKKCAL